MLVISKAVRQSDVEQILDLSGTTDPAYNASKKSAILEFAEKMKRSIISKTVRR